jgi:RimJ/RimL family protein N-acetyltransferase
MINIAHPDFRKDLLKYAKKCNYVYSDQKLPKSVKGRVSIYPDKYETTYKVNDKEITVRPVKPTDERKIQELYYSLDEKDRYYRFFTQVKQFPHKRIQNMITIDYSTSMLLVGETQDEEKKLIALSGFFKTKNPSEAEIAIVVHEEWRNKGIAKYFLNFLVEIGRELGYKIFSGTVLKENSAMLHILKNLNYPFSVENIEGNTLEFSLDIRKTAEKEE